MYSLRSTELLFSLSVFFSLFLSFLLSSALPSGDLCSRITGLAMEFSAGFTVSVILLSLVPEAYGECSPQEMALFILLGVGTAMCIQEGLKYKYKLMSAKNRLAASGKLSALSLGVGGSVLGFSAGTGFELWPWLGVGLGASAALRLFPRGTATFLAYRTSGKTFLQRLMLLPFLTLPWVVGLKAGLYFGKTETITLLRILLFSGGMELYTAVGDLSRESKTLCKGRFLPVFHLLGTVCGMMLVLSL